MRKIFIILLLAILSLSASGCSKNAPITQPSENLNSLNKNNLSASAINTNTSKSSSTDFSPATTQAIVIGDDNFSPSVVQVKVGDTVTWKNSSAIQHSIRSDSFSSGNLRTNDTFSYQFPTAGTFDYTCGIHPEMTGQVIVR